MDMELLASRKVCDICGTSVDFDMPGGFCPGCLLNTVLETQSDSAAGSHIEDYELLGEVGRGGMGIVYRARQRTPSRVVALKMILPAHLGSPGAVHRFRAEAEAAASLDHESILPIYAVGEADGAPFYSMKFAESGTLSARIDSYRDKPREAAALVAKLARAIAFAHERRILHRDLKPGNVLFDSAGKPYVSDFGLAKWVQRECDLTQTLAILGTPYYMAPEQATDSRGVTAAADIYSLGAILYHMLAGFPPVSGETPMEVLHRAAAEQAKSPRLTNRNVPRDLEVICLKCLDKEPASRYASAVALAEDLERYCADRPILGRRAGLTNRSWRWMKRNRVLAGLGATTVALLIVLTTIVPVRRMSAPATKAVAVLPFDHPGADKTGELLASGLQGDILVSLSKIADLKVISRNSVARYAGTQADPAEIGRALGVDAVIAGSLRQDGHHARINVQLTRVSDGTEMWAENFDREINDVMSIQSDLALQIASVLKATVLPMEANGIRRRPTDDSQAYLLYVQANDLFADPDKPRRKLERAEQLLRQAVDRDPKFALAIALLSQTETILADEYDKAPARLQEARQLAQRALRLDTNLPEAHMAMGRYLWQGQRYVGETDLAGAAREFELALRSLPGSAEVHTLVGRVQRQQGKWLEALANVEKAAALDPNTPIRWEAVYAINLWMRHYPAASRAIERAIALNPNSWRCEWLRALLARQWKGDLSALAHLRPPPESQSARELYVNHWFNALLNLRRFDAAEEVVRNDPRKMMPTGLSLAPKSYFLGYVYAAKKDQLKACEYFEAALPIMEHAVTESPLDAGRHMDLADVYAQLHRKDDAIREGKRACELLPESKSALDGVNLLTELAFIYMQVGELELAFPLLEHSLSVPGGAHVGALRTSIDWEPFRDGPRFQQLLARYEPRD
jgi:TolB-like protein/regulator of sirC expression with transglutaminase-like and TPR domain